MAELTKETIQNLTKLCRIPCSEQEQAAILQDLQKILFYTDQLQEVDTENVAPCDYVLEDMVNVMREDVTGETLPRDLFLANAPAHTRGLIRIPPVMNATP